jgi:hypothetical protein
MPKVQTEPVAYVETFLLVAILEQPQSTISE